MCGSRDKGETLKVRAEALLILLIQGDPRFNHLKIVTFLWLFIESW